MRPILRLASFGGWLAHLVNQNTLWNLDFSATVRPGFVLVYIFGSGLGPVVIVWSEVQYLLGYSSHPPIRPGEELGWIPFGLPGLIALLLIVGWLVRFVPFMSDNDQTPSPAAPVELGSDIAAHATGIFKGNDGLHRFRHRPARIQRRKDGVLHVAVKENGKPFYMLLLGSGATEPATSAWARLLPSSIGRIRRGTAHLVFDARPALEIGWLHGPILLDFDDAETRDRVLVELRRMVGAEPAR